MMVTAFLEESQIAQGGCDEVKRLLEEGYAADLGSIRVFDDLTGRIVDLDYWDALRDSSPKGRGRPRLGVRSREVTLLPQQWDWLARQPGGASAALRRLVEDARRKAPDERARKDAMNAFMRHTCGDRPNYEEALRALYRDDNATFDDMIAAWPADLSAFIKRLRELGPKPE